MDFEVLANLSGRTALIALVAALVALLALYVVVVFVRLHRLKRASSETGAPADAAARSAISAYSAEQASPSPSPAPDAGGEPELLSAPSASAFPWNEPPDEFPGQQRVDALEREVTQLRREVGGLRAEVLMLREEKQREVEQAQQAQHVSPMYSDAMQMALQGHDAASISEHCGIARAEAELVVALVRNRNN